MSKRNFKIWRGNKNKGNLTHYAVDVDKGMVVLDVIHKIQKLRKYIITLKTHKNTEYVVL